jgi:hypothetical protein
MICEGVMGEGLPAGVGQKRAFRCRLGGKEKDIPGAMIPQMLARGHRVASET